MWLRAGIGALQIVTRANSIFKRDFWLNAPFLLQPSRCEHAEVGRVVSTTRCSCVSDPSERAEAVRPTVTANQWVGHSY